MNTEHKNTENTTSCNTNKRGRCWALTINNYVDDDIVKLESLEKQYKDSVWQSEIGESGTKHLQIGLYFKNAKTFEQVKKHFPKAHIERARNWAALKKYCNKEDTFDGKIRKDSEKSCLNVCTFDPMEGLDLKPWQNDILDILKEKPDNRSIYWFWEPLGGAGKTTFIKSLMIKNSNYVYISGKVADIKYGVFKFVSSKKIGPKAIFMNIPRSVEHVSWNGLEQVKDGMFFNTKYESEPVLYDPPHVMVFANEPPSNLDMMSIDRWKIIQIA